ncbi:MAG: serine/threonine protein kinase, partial [Deltaproteobacteria bacterium]|nr:serine/threonine protein kinase [Deltaproteobacteria bacterium]
MQEPIAFGGYKLVKRLAVSSMSEVFLAFPETKPADPRPVIIKRLLDDVAAVDAFVDLFHNEANLAAFMHHPNVVQFLEFGEVEGQLYLAMEYVEGMDLWRLTRRLKRAGEKLPPAQAIYIVIEILKALSYVHALAGETGERLNIVHHDVSPSNIMLGRNAEVKLGDFGIAYSEQNLEKLGRKFKGKVFYLSPEQVKGDRVDHRSDLYSAGVVLTELVLGKRPFTGPTDLSILINVRDRNSPVLDEALETLPPDLAEILGSALATDPDERFPDANLFRSSLEEVLTPGDLETAARELPETIHLVTRSTDGVEATIRPRRSSGYNLYSALTTPLPVELVAGNADEESSTPVTPIRSVTDYEIKKVDGGIVGTMPLSTAIEGIVLGRIQEEDLVSVAGEEYRSVQSVPELSKHLPSVTPTTQRHDLGLPDRRGIIADIPAGHVLLEMYRAGETGLVIFECAGVRKEVHIEEGVPRFVSSNMASELLGEFLVRIGSISRMELDMALAVLDRYEGHLGDTLLGL